MSKKALSGGVVGFDIETTHLKGNMGHILCAVAATADRKWSRVWRIDQQKGWSLSKPKSLVDDKQMVADIVETLSHADVVITHYGTYFDLPFVNTRALFHGLNPLPPIAHLDMWKVARKHLALTSNRQATINDLISAEHGKYKPGWEVWREAQYGDKKALTTLANYCENDVQGLLDNYRRLLPLINNHPVFRFAHRPDACPACGSDATQRRGFRRTKRQSIERIQCQSCGTWYDGKKVKV